jgi:DNA-binding MarR family transcriptional regulator
MDSPNFLIIPLLQAFSWFDEGLQSYLQARGWPHVTRPQSMVMAHVVRGVTRPSDIARILGVSRQAIHTTLGQMIEIGLLELARDAGDGRSKRVVITATGGVMRAAAQEAMGVMSATLEERIGKAAVDSLHDAFAADWGAPLDFSREPQL